MNYRVDISKLTRTVADAVIAAAVGGGAVLALVLLITALV